MTKEEEDRVTGYLDAEVLLAVVSEGHADGVVDHVGDTIQNNFGDRLDPLERAPAADGLIYVGLLDLPSAERQHKKILHPAGARELALVVQHMRDGGDGGVVHHNSPVDCRARRLAIHGRDVSGAEEWGRGRRRPAHLPQVKVPRRALERGRAREQEWPRAREVVARH